MTEVKKVLVCFTDLRVQAGYTQQQLADEIGVDRSCITKYEASLFCPCFKGLLKLAEVLQCNYSVLAGVMLNSKNEDSSSW